MTPPKHVGDHVAPAVAVAGLGGTAGRRTDPAPVCRPAARLRLVDERDQFVAGDAVLLCGPVAPAIRGLDGGAVFLAAELRLGLLALLQVVEELQEHDPGEHGQPVQVAVEPLVLPHDVAGRLDEAAQAAGRWFWGLSVLAVRFFAIGLGFLSTSIYAAAYSRVCNSATASRSRSAPPNLLSNLHDVAVFGDRRHFQHVGDDELRRAVLGVLFQQFLQDVPGLGAVLVEEVLAFGAEPLGPFPPGPQRGVEGQVAEQVERVGVRLLGGLGQFVEVDAPLGQAVDDLAATVRRRPIACEARRRWGTACAPCRPCSR